MFKNALNILKKAFNLNASEVPTDLVSQVQNFRLEYSKTLLNSGFEVDFSPDIHPLVKKVLSVASEASPHFKKMVKMGMEPNDIKHVFAELAKGLQYSHDIYGFNDNINFKMGNSFNAFGIKNNDVAKVSFSRYNSKPLTLRISYGRVSRYINHQNEGKMHSDPLGLIYSPDVMPLVTGIHEGIHLHEYSVSLKNEENDIEKTLIGINLEDNLEYLTEKCAERFNLNTEHAAQDKAESVFSHYANTKCEIHVMAAIVEARDTLGLKTKIILAEEPQEAKNLLAVSTIK